MITFTTSGSTAKTQAFLKAMQTNNIYSGLEALGQRGVEALRSATPVDTGATAAAWGYRINLSGGSVTIEWFNTNINAGVNIAVILQYGHGTGTGGYVAGRDYINGAIKPIFDQIADEVWKKVTSA